MHVASFGASGVHIFFVISGFIIVWTNHNRFGRASNISAFLKRRFVRIFPIYWALAAINIILLDMFANINLHTVGEVIGGAMLLPGHSSKLIFVGWTLSFELFFYGVFAFFLMMRQATALIAFSVLFTGLAGVVVSIENPFLDIATNSLLLEFVMGAWIAVVARSAESIPNWVPRLLLGAGGLGLIATAIAGHDALPTVISFGVPSALMVAGLVFSERQSTPKKFLKRLNPLGDSSYSLYLAHAVLVPPITIAAGRVLKFNDSLGLALVLALIAACIFVSHGVYLWVERPLIRFTRRFIVG